MNRFKNFRVKISYLTREMTIDRNTIPREATYIRRETVCKVVKRSIRQGKYEIDKIRVENKQSELRLKGKLATRIELIS